MDQHPDAARIRRFLQALRADTSITSANKKYIEDFYNYSVERGLGFSGQMINVMEGIYWAKLIPDFRTSKKDDIRKAVSALMERTDYAGYTKIKKLSVLRSMYKHLFGKDEKYPDSVLWISRKNVKIKTKEKKMDDMITRADLELLIKACKNSQEAALIYFLWETGVRAGELLTIKKSGIKDAGTHYTVEVDGKTGRRNLAFVEAIPYLKMWLNEHPLKNDKEAPLFCVNFFKDAGVSPLTKRHLNLILKRVAMRADFKKPVNPHSFRHSSASDKAPHLSQAVLCNYYGWTQGSPMPGTYIHMNNTQANNEILKLHGINPDADVKPQPIKTIKCQVCGEDNLLGNSACAKCAKMFDTSKVIDMDARMKNIEKINESLADLIISSSEPDVIGDKEIQAQIREIAIELKKKSIARGNEKSLKG